MDSQEDAQTLSYFGGCQLPDQASLPSKITVADMHLTLGSGYFLVFVEHLPCAETFIL